MASHLSDENLISFIDNELSPTKADSAGSHLKGCGNCRSKLEEMRSKSDEFEQLQKQVIPVDFPHSDLFAGQLRRRLTQLCVMQAPFSSLENNMESGPEISIGRGNFTLADSCPNESSQSSHLTIRSTLKERGAKRSFRLLKQTIDQDPDVDRSAVNLRAIGRVKEHRFLTQMVWSLPFTDGEILFKKGLLAYRQGSIEQAIEYWRRAKTVFLGLDFLREIAACDRNMAFAHRKLGQREKAIEQFEKAKNLYQAIGQTEEVIACDLKIRDLRERPNTPGGNLSSFAKALPSLGKR